jgi:hypothetical protein
MAAGRAQEPVIGLGMSIEAVAGDRAIHGSLTVAESALEFQGAAVPMVLIDRHGAKIVRRG